MNDDPRADADHTKHDAAESPPARAASGRAHGAPPDAAPTAVSTVMSDRVCVSCGYNLIGQSVVREPHYGMLITRCPECGVYAGLQEFPLTGIWARRLGFAFAAIVMILMLCALPATSVTLFGIGSGLTELRSSRVSDQLQAQFMEDNQAPDGTVLNQQQFQYAQWYASLEPVQHVAIAEPWAPPTPLEFAMLVLAMLAAAAAGLVWAALLTGRSAVARLIWWMLITSLLGIAVATSIIGHGVTLSGTNATAYITPWNTSASLVTPRILPLVTGATALILLTIMLAGDRLILLTIRLLLPPRMQRLFARAPFGLPR